MSIKLTPELRSAAGRLAVEELRSATWARAAEIRREAFERLQAGDDVDDVTVELEQRIRAVRAAQTL